MKNTHKLSIKILNRIKIASLLLLILLSSFFAQSQTEDPVITKLFQNSYKVIDGMRIKTAPGVGIYLDALAINTGDKPVALAANGVGLISLCIADAMYKKTGDAVNWDANAEAKALQTINEWIRLKNTRGAVNVNGLFHRYLDPKDGSYVWGITEHSTIDNAIMAAGFLFCKNYFNKNAEIVAKTTELLNSMDFTAAISGNTMYMVLEDNGARSVVANPFNEYIVLAWFAKNSNPSFAGYANAQTYWNNNFSDATKLPKFDYPAGNSTLSEGSFAQPSFHVQFAYYYCNYFMNNAAYMTFFKNQAVADRTWWKNNTTQQTAWGNGAGEVPGGGYSADAIYKNPDMIVSPHIIAGFSPVDTNVKNDLVALYGNGTGPAVYKIPGTNREFLWRYKFRKTTDRASYVQSVDFSTMLYGLAALPEYLGVGFFNKYNDFKFDPATSASAVETQQKLLSVYPNPFTKKTTLVFELEKKARVKIDVYSEKGDLVLQLVNEQMAAGRHAVDWDATNDQKVAVEKGTYFCRLAIDDQPLQTKQLIVVK